MDKITYNTTKPGFAEVTINGEKVRCRSFKLEHDADGAPVATIELIAPDVRLNAICDLVNREIRNEM